MRPYERFLEYISINTRSDETTGTHPSFDGEFDLARMLKGELEDIGIEADLDDKCYLIARIPASEGYEDYPVLGFISHMDTAPVYSGCNVKPVIYQDYDGGDVIYPCGKIMKAEDYPHLHSLVSETLITSDGTTLLGADDKAGIAEIMSVVEHIVREGIPHCPLAICFTPDEEIGEGTDNFDIEKFGADMAYTVDGGDVCEIEYENFNAADALVEITGLSTHPGTAKDVMINAVNVAHDYHGMLPINERPEHTEGYEGFYHLLDMCGDCSSAKLHYIVRDHDRTGFEERKEFLRKCADKINAAYGAGTVRITITDSYYNMLEMITPHMHLIDSARKAVTAAGMVPVTVPIRGGTDGARLSYMGLPCPNLGTGGFNFHGPFEHITAERMDRAVLVILGIIGEYSKPCKAGQNIASPDNCGNTSCEV